MPQKKSVWRTLRRFSRWLVVMIAVIVGFTSLLALQTFAANANSSLVAAELKSEGTTLVPNIVSPDTPQLEQNLLAPPLSPHLSVSTVTSFHVSITPMTAFAGEEILTFTVEARDGNNNIITDYVGDVEFYPSGLSNIPDLHPPIGNSPDYTFQVEDAGRAVFSNITFYEAGQQMVLVEEYGNPSVNGTSNDVDIAEVYLVATISPTSGIVSSPMFTLTVEAQDQYGNVWPGYRGSIEFVESTPSTLPNLGPPCCGNSPDYVFTEADAGRASFNFAFHGAGQQNVYIYDHDNQNGRNTTSDDVEVQEIYLSAIISPAIGIARDPVFTLTIEARDISGTLRPDYAGGIEIEPSATVMGLPQIDPPFNNSPDDIFTPSAGGRLVYTNFSFEEQGQQNVYVYELAYPNRDVTSSNVDVTGPPPPTPAPPGPQPPSYTISNPLAIPPAITYTWGLPFIVADDFLDSNTWRAYPEYAISTSGSAIYLIDGQFHWRYDGPLSTAYYVCPYLAWENPMTDTRPSGGGLDGGPIAADYTAIGFGLAFCSSWTGPGEDSVPLGLSLSAPAPIEAQGVHLDVHAGGNSAGQVLIAANSPLGDTGECDGVDQGQTVGDPIDTRSGEFYYVEQDFGIETGCDGISLQFERTYRSMGPTNGIFGPGWTHNYNQAVIDVGNDYVAVRRPRGTYLLFKDIGGDVYATRAGANHTLLKRPGGGWALIRQDRKVALFDADGRLIAEQDRYGNLIWLTYEEYERDGLQGIRLARVDAPGGRYLWFGYDYYKPWVITQVSNHLSHTVNYTYDDDGLLVSVRNRLGEVTTYTYSNWLLASKTDPLGNNVFSNGYDNGGRVLTQTNYMGQSLSLSYSWTTTTLTATVTEETTGAVTNYIYGAHDGLLQRIIDADGQETHIPDHTFARRPTAVVDPLSRALGIAYNDLALPTVITDALGHEAQLFYDSFNNVTQTLDARNQATTYGYEDSIYPGFLTGLTDAAGHTTLYTPTIAGVDNTFGGLIKAIQDPKGQVTTYSYSDNGQVIMTVEAAGTAQAMTTTYGYDLLGRLITETRTSPLESHTTFFAYDVGDRLVATIENWDGLLDWTNCDFSAGVRDENVCTLYRYDAIGRVISTTNSLGQTELTIYDDEMHTILTVTNYDGSAFTNPLADLCDFIDPDPTFNLCILTEYDAYGRTVAFTDTLGIRTVTEYDLRGQISRTVENWEDGIFDPTVPDTDIETRYQYDEVGNTIIVTDTLGRMTRTFYDELNRVAASVQNWQGSMQSLSDVQNTCLSLPERRDYDICTLYAYDEAGNTVIITDTLGRMTRTFYDGLNRVVASVQNWNPATLTSPANCVLSPGNDSIENICTLYGYDEVGNQITVTNALNQTTLNVYDELNRPVVQVANWDETTVIDEPADCTFSATATENLCSVTTYDALGRRSSSKDPMGRITEFTYDGLGRVVTTTRYLGGRAISSGTQYDALGNRLQSIDANGNITSYVYDGLNRLLQTTSPEGVVNYSFYDAAGRVVSTTNGLSETTYNQYDALSRLVSTSDPENNQTQFVYDALGNQVAMTDAEGIRTSYLYDDLNRLVAVVENDTGGAQTDDRNVKTQYVYDALGNRVLITNALAVTSTLIIYDELSRPALVADALGNATHYAYDALGNRTTMTDANGAVTTYEYDGLNRLITTTYVADGETVAYSYNAASSRTAMQDALGTTTYVYDDLDRLVSVTNTFSGTVGYDYDDVGNRTRLAYLDGREVAYDYDGDNRLITVSSWLTGTASYAYDPAGRLVTTTLPNGVVSVNTFDAAGRLTNLRHESEEGALLANYAYGLDQVGNRVVATETLRLPTTDLALSLGTQLTTTVETGDQRLVAVAHNPTADEYLAVWMDLRTGKADIYGQRLDGVGNSISDTIALETNADWQTDPRIAYSPAAGTYLLVWADKQGSDWDVYGLLLDNTGQPLSSTLAIDDNGGVSSEHPDVAYDAQSGGFVVVWSRAGFFNSIYARSVSTDGSLGSIFTVAGTGGGANKDTPAIAGDGAGEFLVAWQDGEGSNADIKGRRISASSALGSVFAIGDASNEQDRPAIAHHAGSDQYLVVWEDTSAGGRRIMARFVAGDGSLPGTAFLFDQSGAPPGFSPAALALADGFLVAAHRHGGINTNVIIGTVTLAGTPGNRQALSEAAGNQLDVALAGNGQTALVLWESQELGSDYDIFGKQATVALTPGALQTTTITYDYDPLYRLRTAVYTGAITATYEYTYDGVGNMTAYTETVGAAATTHVTRVFDDANRLVVSQDVEEGTISFLYDNNGNLIQIRPPGDTFSGTLRYGYDQRNMLITNTLYVTGTGWVSLTDYVYDGDSNRVQQIIFDNGTPITTTYHNDNSGLSQVLVAERGITQTHNLFGLDLILQDDGNEARTLLADGLGSVRTELVNDSVDAVTTYEPYGNLIMRTGTSGTTYDYTGEQRDAVSGLIYLRGRYYNPDLKLFMSRDPFPGSARLPASQHPYSYVHNNPVNLTDATGESVFAAGLGAALACVVNPWCLGLSVAVGAVIVGLVLWNIYLAKQMDWQVVGEACLANIEDLVNELDLDKKPEPEPEPKRKEVGIPIPIPRRDAPPDNPDSFVRVRHYSQAIKSIRNEMLIRMNPNSGPAVWVEYPILTKYEEQAIQATTESFMRPLNGIGGFVEFNVDLNKWLMEQDPNLPYVVNAQIIWLFGPGVAIEYAQLGFPLYEPGVDPEFFDWQGQSIR